MPEIYQLDPVEKAANPLNLDFGLYEL